MEIHEIKSLLTIGQILAHYGLKADRNQMLNCPFHPDKTPSFQVYPKTGTFCCFSSNCQAGTGDVIDFIKLKENCTKHEAINKAKAMLGHVNHQQEIQPPYEKLFKLFEANLAKSGQAKEYLKIRNLGTESTGYNATGWAQLKHCIIYPLKDKEGNITSLYGRSIQNDADQRHYYTKNRSGLYPEYPKAGIETLILTESVIDAKTLLQLPGLKAHAILALYGTNGLTAEHTEAIKNLENLKEIILFFDGDAAGKEAVLKTGQKLKALNPNIRISYVDTPDGEDINSLTTGHEQEIFAHLISARKILSPGETKSKEAIIKPTLDTTHPDLITYITEGLCFTLLGGLSLQHLDRMRVTLRTALHPNENPLQSFRHTLDLYNDDQTEKYIRRASERLGLGSSHVSRAMAALVHGLENHRWQKSKEKKAKGPQKRKLDDGQKQKALEYLKAPRLMERTSGDIGKTGVVGEEDNRLLMYLVFTSRLQKKPLHVVSLGASGTGKTYLQEKVAALVPEQDKVELTSSSENAFYYFGEGDLSHKLVLIEDMEGIGHMLYPIRELQSKARISKTVPLKDSKGNLKTVRVEVEGPICLAGTTTKERIYQDNADRCLLVYLDNSPGQQQKIMEYQRQLSAGKADTKEEETIKERFRDIQSILRPIKTVNPYAEQLKVPEAVLKPLRTNAHYLAFIEAITFYHQYQRSIKKDKEGVPYIETTLEDIRWANRLLEGVLLAKSDELSGACRKFLENLKSWLQKENRQSFYAKELRAAFRISPDNLKYYLRQLHAYGHIKITGGNRYRKGFEYEVEDIGEYEKLKNHVDTTLDGLLQKASG